MKKKYHNLFLCVLFIVLPINANAEPNEQSLNFFIKAHISSNILGYGITDFEITPNSIDTTYDLEKETFDESLLDMRIVTNIPTGSKEKFQYDLMLVKNESSCLLLNGDIKEYDPPEIIIENSEGISTEITEKKPITNITFNSEFSGFKSDDEKINIKYKKISSELFTENVHHCSGSISLIAGLSL